MPTKQRKLIYEEVIQPGNGWAGIVKKGQYLRIIDLEGQQPGDLVFFNADNIKECNCHGITRSRQFLGKPGEPVRAVDKVTEGSVIFSTTYRPMATIVADTPVKKGVHDLYFHMCNKKIYEYLGYPGREGCWEIESRILAKYGIAPEQLPDPLNIFMNTEHDIAAGEYHIKEPVTRPGDYIELRLEMDCILGLACCPMDVGPPVVGGKPTPLKVEVCEQL